MCFKLVKQVLDEVDGLSGMKKLVLVILAEYVNHKNGNNKCWPSMPAIAKRAGVSRRYVIEVLKELEAEGYIRIERSRGRNHTNTYHLNVNPSSHIENVNYSVENVNYSDENVNPSSPEPVEPEIEPGRTPQTPHHKSPKPYNTFTITNQGMSGYQQPERIKEIMENIQ